MRITRSQSEPFLGVVCCQHGHEIFGLKVFNHLEREAQRYPGLIAVVANEEAVRAGKRFIETDLNRSYPGQPNGTHEERLAARIVDELAGAKFVLDIHTTTCETDLVPFCGEMNESVRRIVGLAAATDIVAVGGRLAKQSLLGAVPVAVSLEYGERYAQERGLNDLIQLISDLYTDAPCRNAERHVFTVRESIPLDAVVPADAKDFMYCPELAGYPVLLGEKSYTDKRGFVANEPRSVVL